MQPISFHHRFDTADKVHRFLVVVPDETVNLLNYGHPLRALHTAFNGGISHSKRLRLLADALHEAEVGGISYPGFFPYWWRALRDFTRNLFARPHPDDVLVERFARALKQKLAQARADGKQGWEFDDWMDRCRTALVEHIIKGDPRDVANFCAFLWYHNQGTAQAFDDFNRIHRPRKSDDESTAGPSTRIIYRKNAPVIVCLCGSTRFSQAFRDANLTETMAERIVLSIGCDTKNDAELFGQMPALLQKITKRNLDLLHIAKIELCDEVLVLNVDGYVGESTRREIRHALKLQKPIRWLEAEHAERNRTEAENEK